MENEDVPGIKLEVESDDEDIIQNEQFNQIWLNSASLLVVENTETRASLFCEADNVIEDDSMKAAESGDQDQLQAIPESPVINRRGKVDMSFVEDSSERSKVKLARRRGLFRKAFELITRCGGNILLVYYDLRNQCFVYTNNEQIWTRVRETRLHLPDFTNGRCKRSDVVIDSGNENTKEISIDTVKRPREPGYVAPLKMQPAELPKEADEFQQPKKWIHHEGHVEMKYMDDQRQRANARCARRKGMLKKAYELVQRCHGQVLVSYIDEKNDSITYTTNEIWQRLTKDGFRLDDVPSVVYKRFGVEYNNETHDTKEVLVSEVKGVYFEQNVDIRYGAIKAAQNNVSTRKDSAKIQPSESTIDSAKKRYSLRTKCTKSATPQKLELSSAEEDDDETNEVRQEETSDFVPLVKHEPEYAVEQSPEKRVINGRVKVDISFVKDSSERSKVKLARRRGLFRKAFELITKCGGNILLVYYDLRNQCFVYTNNEHIWTRVRETRLHLPDFTNGRCKRSDLLIDVGNDETKEFPIDTVKRPRELGYMSPLKMPPVEQPKETDECEQPKKWIHHEGPIEIKYMDDPKQRGNTRSSRRKNMLKKAYELVQRCHGKILVSYIDEKNDSITYTTDEIWQRLTKEGFRLDDVPSVVYKRFGLEYNNETHETKEILISEVKAKYFDQNLDIQYASIKASQKDASPEKSFTKLQPSQSTSVASKLDNSSEKRYSLRAKRTKTPAQCSSDEEGEDDTIDDSKEETMDLMTLVKSELGCTEVQSVGGRRHGKVDISYAENPVDRWKSKSARRRGLFKKSFEIVTRCGGNILLMYYDERGQCFVYTNREEIWERVKGDGFNVSNIANCKCKRHHIVLNSDNETVEVPVANMKGKLVEESALPVIAREAPTERTEPKVWSHHEGPVEITYYNNPRQRANARSTRRKGMFKKAFELTERCGGHVLVSYMDEKNDSITYTNNDDMWKLLIRDGLRILSFPCMIYRRYNLVYNIELHDVNESLIEERKLKHNKMKADSVLALMKKSTQFRTSSADNVMSQFSKREKVNIDPTTNSQSSTTTGENQDVETPSRNEEPNDPQSTTQQRIRQKVDISYVKDPLERAKIKFARRQGVFRKAFEIVKRCGGNTLAVYFDDKQQCFTYTSSEEIFSSVQETGFNLRDFANGKCIRTGMLVNSETDETNEVTLETIKTKNKAEYFGAPLLKKSTTIMNMEQDKPKQWSHHKGPIEITYIEDHRQRYNARSARKKGLFKKAYELIQRCGGNLLLVYINENGNSHTFTNSDELWKTLVHDKFKLDGGPGAYCSIFKMYNLLYIAQAHKVKEFIVDTVRVTPSKIPEVNLQYQNKQTHEKKKRPPRFSKDLSFIVDSVERCKVKVKRRKAVFRKAFELASRCRGSILVVYYDDRNQAYVYTNQGLIWKQVQQSGFNILTYSKGKCKRGGVVINPNNEAKEFDIDIVRDRTTPQRVRDPEPELLNPRPALGQMNADPPRKWAHHQGEISFGYIENTKNRSNAVTARRKGLFKRAHQLTEQCGGQIVISYVSERDDCFTFTNNDVFWAKLQTGFTLDIVACDVYKRYNMVYNSQTHYVNEYIEEEINVNETVPTNQIESTNPAVAETSTAVNSIQSDLVDNPAVLTLMNPSQVSESSHCSNSGNLNSASSSSLDQTNLEYELMQDDDYSDAGESEGSFGHFEDSSVQSATQETSHCLAATDNSYDSEAVQRSGISEEQKRGLFEHGLELTQKCGGKVAIVYIDDQNNASTFTNSNHMWEQMVTNGMKLPPCNERNQHTRYDMVYLPHDKDNTNNKAKEKVIEVVDQYGRNIVIDTTVKAGPSYTKSSTNVNFPIPKRTLAESNDTIEHSPPKRFRNSEHGSSSWTSHHQTLNGGFSYQ